MRVSALQLVFACALGLNLIPGESGAIHLLYTNATSQTASTWVDLQEAHGFDPLCTGGDGICDCLAADMARQENVSTRRLFCSDFRPLGSGVAWTLPANEVVTEVGFNCHGRYALGSTGGGFEYEFRLNDVAQFSSIPTPNFSSNDQCRWRVPDTNQDEIMAVGDWNANPALFGQLSIGVRRRQSGQSNSTRMHVNAVRLQVHTAVIDNSAISFGSVLVGESAQQIWTITNSATTGNLIGNVQLSGCSAEFSVLNGGAFNLAPGASRVVTITYAPTNAGADACTIALGVRGITRSLSGTGTDPVCTLSTTGHDFGGVAVNGSQDFVFSISNNDGGILSGTVGLGACDPEFTLPSGAGAYSLAFGESHDVTVRFSPTSAGARSCVVSTGCPSNVTIDGDGIDPRWVGYQTPCGGNDNPDQGSFFHGENWQDFGVPGATERALFGTEFDIAPSGYPNVVHFGDFCFQAGSCPAETIPGGAAQVTDLEIRDDVWTFDFGPGGAGCSPSGASGSLAVSGTLTVGTGGAGSADLTLINGTSTAGSLEVGALGGSGSVHVEGGAQLDVTGVARIGGDTGSYGELAADGLGSVVDFTGTLDVGEQGEGSVALTDGAELQVAGLELGRLAGGVASIDIGDGLVTSAATVTSGGVGQARVTLQGGTLDAPLLDVRGNSTFSGVGSIPGDVTGQNCTSTSCGTWLPGGAGNVGTLTFGSNLDLPPGGALLIDIASAKTGNDNDKIQIGGSLTIDGTLSINLLNGFVPAPGDSFTIIEYTGGLRSGDSGSNFGCFAGLDIGDSLSAVPVPLPTEYVLVVEGTPPANNAPVAVPDTMFTDIDVPIEINILANDFDPDMDGLRIVSLDTSFLKGSVVVETDSTLYYTPPAGDSGLDSLRYHVTDCVGGVDSTTVILAVEPVTAAPIQPPSVLSPSTLALYPPVPNPFDRTTTVRWSMPTDAETLVRVYNVQGKVVRELASGRHAPGEHVVTWNGRDGSGQQVATGVYFVRVVAGQESRTQRVTLLK